MDRNIPEFAPTATRNALPLTARITLGVCLTMCGAVAVISLLSVFFYPFFAAWMGQPYDGLLRMNHWMIRSLFLGSTVIYSVAGLGCLMMWQRKKKGYRVFAVPAFMLFGASLFFVFSPLSVLQLIILTATLLILSLYQKYMV